MRDHQPRGHGNPLQQLAQQALGGFAIPAAACSSCALKPRGTPDKHKRVKRWQNEDVLDRMQARLDRMPQAMTIRRQTVEHPFGTIRAWVVSTHFLTKTPDKVETEMSLHVLAYSMKQMISILVVRPLLKARAD